MSLKPDRNVEHDRVDFYMNEVASRGGIASISTGASGYTYDEATNLATYAADPSGVIPLGVLLQDMVEIDSTLLHFIKSTKDETQTGTKVRIMTKGMIISDLIEGTPTGDGEIAYMGPSGRIGTAAAATVYGVAGTDVLKVGRFFSEVDSDGYAKVDINIT